jgi:hypothetical protein
VERYYVADEAPAGFRGRGRATEARYAAVVGGGAVLCVVVAAGVVLLLDASTILTQCARCWRNVAALRERRRRRGTRKLAAVC